MTDRQEQANTIQPSPGRVRAAKLLIVDDHPENLLSMEAVLKELPAAIVLARSGPEALRHLLTEDYAAILLDVSMPGMDGFETAQLIRQRERSRQVPIIFLTAISKSEANIFKGYALGAVDYLLKPFSAEILRAKVSVFIDLFQKTELVREQEERLRALLSREHRRELAKAMAQRNRFFYLSLDLMCTLGFDGRLKEFNAAWEAALGIPREELLSRPLLDFVHPEDRDRAAAHWLKLESPGVQSHSFEARFLARDGDVRWLLWSSQSFPHERLHYAVARDITGRKLAEEDLRRGRDELELRVRERTRELERSNSDLSLFAYTVSHELLEPVRKLVAFGELLGEAWARGDAAAGPDYLQRMRNAALRMQGLIQDILALGRVTSQTRPLEPVELSAVAREAAAARRDAVEAAQAEIRIESLPVVQADSLQMRLLFDNLLGNSLKFRRPETPLAVRIDTVPGPEGFTALTYEDNGTGFEEQYAEKVFQPFLRLHNRTQYPGSGMGLAICQRIMLRHGGGITAEGRPGVGARFTLTFPRPPAAPPPTP